MFLKILFFSNFMFQELTVMPPSIEKVEARSRKGKGQRGRRRGGSGLR